MAKKYTTNADRILKAVLDDSELTKFGNYAPYEYADMETALASENHIIVAVARIIQGKAESRTDKDIYKEVSNYLKERI